LPKGSWLLKYGLKTYQEETRRRADKETRRQGKGETEGLRLIPLAREVSDGMPGRMVALIEDALVEVGRALAGAKVVLLLGVASRRTPVIRATNPLQRWRSYCWCVGRKWWRTTDTCERRTGARH
jgi:hypothetical protein